jgi:hypothetical protein
MKHIREEEMGAVRATQMFIASSQFLALSLPSFICIATFGTYVAMTDVEDSYNHLTPARAFTSLALLSLLANPLAKASKIVSAVLEMMVRSTDYLRSFFQIIICSSSQDICRTPE